MASASPSEFLTFMRHVVVRSTLRPTAATVRQCPQRFAPASIRTLKNSGYSGKEQKEHMIDRADKRKDTLDIQADQGTKGRQHKADKTGGSATEQRDSEGSTAKAKRDHPEAPDTVIGMQDERGAKGA